MCGATATIAAQYHGGKRLSRIGFQVYQTGWIGALTAILITAILALSVIWLPLVQPEGNLTTIAIDYLQVLALGCFGFTLTAVLRGTCEAIGDTGLAMLTNGVLFLFNLFFDYVLVFGKFGFPELGPVGCAWASVLSYWILAFLLTGFLIQQRKYQKLNLFNRIWRPKWSTIKSHLGICVPLALGTGGEVFFFSSIALFVVPFGTVPVASHQIVINFSSLIYMIPLGFSVALCIRCASLRGSNQNTDARFSAFTGVKMATAIACVTAVLTIALRHPVAAVYTPDKEVQTLVAQLLFLCAFYQITDAIQVASWGGLRGFGDMKIPMVMQLISYWVVGFPCGYFLAHEYDLGIFGFWTGILIGLTCASLLLFLRLRSLTAKYKLSTE
jgi:MATE family multidrug resistance protein